MTPVVAVQAGVSATRLAAHGPDGRPEVVATLPAGTAPAAALEALYGDAPVPLVVLVHPPGQGPEEVAAAVEALRPWAVTVRPIPAPLAVLAVLRDAAPRPAPDPARPSSGPPRLSPYPSCRSSGPPRPSPDSPRPSSGPPRLVVDAGASGTDLTVVVGERVLPPRRVDVGGDRLDAVLGAALALSSAQARPVRESLSWRAEVVLPGGGRGDATRCREVLRPVLAELSDAVGEVARRSGAAEVVLAGGLAGTPLLAETLDGIVAVPVRTVERPESAAVLGASALPDPVGERDVTAVPAVCGSPDVPLATSDHLPGGRRPALSVGGAGSRSAGPSPPAGAPGSAVARGRRWVRLRGAPVVAALGIALVAAGTVAGRGPAETDPSAGAALVVQYGYSTVLPAGWEHTGGRPESRRTLLTRAGSPAGAELIAVERTPLGYDSAVEPERARAELAAEFRRRSGEEDLRDYRDDTVAGRPVVRYRQAGPGPAVDWFVLFTGTDELVVGCRYPDAPAVAPACAAVVASVRPTG